MTRGLALILAALAITAPAAAAPADTLQTGTGEHLALSSLVIPSADAVEWEDLPEYRYERLSPWRLGVVLGGVAIYDGAFYQTLKKPWWSGTSSDFHIVNDWWGNYALENDKLAHAWSGQVMASVATGAYQWTGMSRRQALFWGGVTSLATLTQVEVLDGFTEKFGFSPGDYTANAVGAFFPLAQEMIPPLRHASYKLSYHPARMEPDAYRGRTEPNRLEDYSRQTYWLAFNVHGMLPEGPARYWPSWLQVAVGYGVDNAFALPESERMREIYLALDFDPSRIETSNTFLAAVLAPFRYIHLPAPAIRFRRDGTRAFALYF